MGLFFARLSADMAGGPTAATVEDMLTVLAALVHAHTPRSVDQLVTALSWPPDRVTRALRDAEQHPDIADPVALKHAGPDTYTITAKADRLTPTQREALSRPPPQTAPEPSHPEATPPAGTPRQTST